MKKESNKIHIVIPAIFACLNLLSCNHPLPYFVLPNFIETDNANSRNENIGDYSIYLTHLPNHYRSESYTSCGVYLSFQSDSCFDINEHDICATIGKNTISFEGWGLLYNKDSTYNGNPFFTPSFSKSKNINNFDTSFPSLAQKLEVPKGNNVLFCSFGSFLFSSPIRVSVSLRGVQTNPVVLELKPERAVIYNLSERLVKWDEKTIVKENDSVCVYLSRQPIIKDSCELLCLFYFDTFGKTITNANQVVKKKRESASYYSYNSNGFEVCFRDTSYCYEVLDDTPLFFLKPFCNEDIHTSQANIFFKIKRKDGGVIENIPDLILPPSNLLLKDDVRLLRDSIVFKGFMSPLIE